jgi:hypothetical protein
MEAVKIETTVSEDGSVSLPPLPFSPGSRIEVIVLGASSTPNGKKDYALRGRLPYQYDDPFEPLVANDWEVQG